MGGPERVAIGQIRAALDRPHRLAYVLADVFDLSHDEAADLCGVQAAVHRQRVSRARRSLDAFTRSFCGLVHEKAPCHCSRRVAQAERLGRLHRHAPILTGLAAETLTTATQEIEALHEAARLMRQHPSYITPEQVARRLPNLLGASHRRVRARAHTGDTE